MFPLYSVRVYVSQLWYRSSSGLYVTMTSSSPSSPPPSSLLTSSSSFHLPPFLSIRQSTSTKLDYLYEVSLLDDTQKIYETDLPLVNPYHAFAKKSPFVIRNIKLSSNNLLVWPKNMFKLHFLTNIKFLLLLANNLLLLKFQANGFLKDIHIFILVLFY
jgi:hypothetical protein